MENEKTMTTDQVFTNDKYWWQYDLNLDKRKRIYPLSELEKFPPAFLTFATCKNYNL